MIKNTITIDNIIKANINEHHYCNSDILISDVTEMGMFSYPCHLRAITVFICLEGSFDLKINLQTFRIKSKCVIVNFPENIIQISEAASINAIAVLISPESLQELSLDGKSFAFYFMQSHNFYVNDLSEEELDNLMKYVDIIKFTQKHYTVDEKNVLIKSLASSFAINMMMLKDIRQNDKPIQSERAGVLILERFLNLVRNHHHQERELAFYAEKMCITPKHLSACIKKVSGKKASELIGQHVVLEAKSMLKYSGLNIKEIALDLNFPTLSSFGKYFKTHVGMSPKEYINSSN